VGRDSCQSWGVFPSAQGVPNRRKNKYAGKNRPLAHEAKISSSALAIRARVRSYSAPILRLSPKKNHELIRELRFFCLIIIRMRPRRYVQFSVSSRRAAACCKLPSFALYSGLSREIVVAHQGKSRRKEQRREQRYGNYVGIEVVTTLGLTMSALLVDLAPEQIADRNRLCHCIGAILLPRKFRRARVLGLAELCLFSQGRLAGLSLVTYVVIIT